LIGQHVTITSTTTMIMIIEPVTGEILAEHRLVVPGETSIVDEHYGRARPDRPRRAPRPRTQVEKDFLALGEAAEAFLVGAARGWGVQAWHRARRSAATEGGARPGTAAVGAAPGCGVPPLRAADVRSILAASGAAPSPQSAGQALVLTLPTVPTRPLSAYKITNPGSHLLLAFVFRFVAAAYERRSLGLGSHWPFEAWGRFLPEHTTAVSMLDRLLHHCHVVITDGDSYRMKQARSKGGTKINNH
jgi:hypothetical protein